MMKLIRSALIGAALLAAASSAMAQTVYSPYHARIAPNPGWTDMSDPYGGYDPNSQAGNRAFWDYIARHGN
jgi:hypothetical protein